MRIYIVILALFLTGCSNSETQEKLYIIDDVASHVYFYSGKSQYNHIAMCARALQFFNGPHVEVAPTKKEYFVKEMKKIRDVDQSNRRHMHAVAKLKDKPNPYPPSMWCD
jgi:hypothetical protein